MVGNFVEGCHHREVNTRAVVSQKMAVVIIHGMGARWGIKLGRLQRCVQLASN